MVLAPAGAFLGGRQLPPWPLSTGAGGGLAPATQPGPAAQRAFRRSAMGPDGNPWGNPNRHRGEIRLGQLSDSEAFLNMFNLNAGP